MKREKNTPVFTIGQQCEDKVINNFKVSSLNELSCTAAEFGEDHRHEYFEIVWLKNGSGVHQIDMADHYYNGSVLFFLVPGQVHKITQYNRSEGYVLKFLPGVFKQENDFIEYVFDTCLFDTARSCQVIAIPNEMNEVLQELFSRFTEEFNKQLPDADIILSSYLKILTTQIRRIRNTYLAKELFNNRPQYELFRKFKIAVEQHYKTKHGVQDYATLLKTQARTLNAVSRKYANKSALEMIHDRILLEAKRGLYHDSKTIKEICYELGFDDPAYFTRFFKKNTGVAPQYFKVEKTKKAMELAS